MVTLQELEEQQSFVKKAAKYFLENPKKSTFTESEIVPGCYFALRWGMDDDCVLLFRLDEDLVPTVYQQAIRDAIQ